VKIRRQVDRLDGILDRVSWVLYGPGPYVAFRWKLAALALLSAVMLLGWAAGP
jgi:hypothetical protein